MSGIEVLVTIAALLAVLGALEPMQHRRALNRIPIQAQINGTEGKPSGTRLIVGALCAGNVRVCARTTGTLTPLIFTDEKEYRIYRPLRANVIEQLRIVRTAADLGAHLDIGGGAISVGRKQGKRSLKLGLNKKSPPRACRPTRSWVGFCGTAYLSFI